MSGDAFFIRQGDTLPVFRYQLLGNNGAPADLSSATAVFQMAPLLGGALKVNAPVTIQGANPQTVTAKALSNNVATLTTAGAHGLIPGTVVPVVGVDATFNGTPTVTSTPTPTTFTYTHVAANVASQASGGTVSAPGIVTYSWAAQDTSVIGNYAGNIVVTFSGGGQQTFPSGTDSYIPITVTEAIPAIEGLQAGPCLPWTDANAVRACVGGLDPNQDLDMWIDAASQILYALTGRQYKGLCIAKIRPAHQECSCGGMCGAHAWGWPWMGAYGFGPFGLPGWGFGWGGGGGARSILLCASEIDLGQDAREVLAVTIGGVAVDPSTYRLDPRGKLVRQPDASGNRLIWPCFSAGTLVLTSTGLRPIEMIQPGEMVLTHKNRWRRVLRSGTTGKSETVKLNIHGGAVRCTPDHRFLSAELYRSYIGSANHRKPQPNGLWPWKLGTPEWSEASDVLGQVCASPRVVEPLPIPLPEGWSETDLPERFWWFVGRWIGDGWTAGGRAKHQVELAARPKVCPECGYKPKTSGDIQRATSFHRSTVHGVPAKKYPHGSTNAGVVLCSSFQEADEVWDVLRATGWRWRRRDERTGVQFKSSSIPLWTWLREQFGVGADGKRLPAWLLGACEEIRRQILEGFLSADGHRGKDGHMSVSTVSREMTVGLRLLVATLGHAASVHQRRQTATHIEGRAVHSHTPYSVRWPRVEAGEPRSGAWIDPEYLWTRVRSVSLSETVVPVYDLEVEEDSSFVAEGFVVHNCCSRTDQPSGGSGVFELTYSYGQAPPDSVVMACNILAGQLALGCNPGTAGMCKLPAHLQTMTRLGVTATFVTDTTVFLAKGFTGLPLVDLVIQSVNSGHVARRGRVVSIDVEPHRLMGP